MQDELTISNLPPGHNLTTSKVEVNMPAPIVTPNSPLVKVVIKYPADWKKDKFFKDGEIKEVSPEAANTFVEIGIATLFNAEVAADEAAVTDVTEGSQEESKVILADPSVLQGETVTGYEGEGQPATEKDEQATETKKGAKKTAGK